MFFFIGKKLLLLLSAVGKISKLFIDTIKWIFKKPFDLKNIISQMVHIGYDSIPVVMLTSLFTGMVFALQTGIGLESTLKGTSTFVGGVLIIALVRELSPVLTALIIAGRIGSSIAAEIGTMQVTEQIDALKTLATNPVQYLSVPRFMALTLMMPVLVILSNFIGWAGGAFVSTFELEIPFLTYFHNSQAALKLGDIMSGLIKASFFGMIIAVIGCYKGFDTRGGAEGVGKSTISSVVISSILILVSDYFLTTFLSFAFNI
ncbi:MAG: ABC transporter permease [Spirochaetes bacterium]|nr:ABC transporter permease [Spirochaetota bacterium]